MTQSPESALPPHPPRPRRRRRVLTWAWNSFAVLALLAVLALVGWAAFSYITEKQLENEVARLEAAGEPLTWHELAAKRIPDDAEAKLREYFLGLENSGAARQYVAAMALMVSRPQDDETKPLNAATAAIAENRSLNEREQQLIDRYLADHELALKLLHEAAQIDDCTFNPFSDFAKVRNQYVDQSRSCGRLLQTHALASLLHGEDEAAARSVVALARMARLFDDQPDLQLHMLSGAYTSMTASVVESLVGRATLTPRVWDDIVDVLSARDDPHAMRRVFQAERIADLHRHFLTASGWHAPIERRQLVERLAVYDEAIAAAEMPWPQQRSILAAFDARSDAAKEMLNWEIVISGEAVNLAMIRCATAAIAVRRFRDQHDRLPATLAELEAVTGEPLPLDPFTGKPLKYAPEPRGFVVYSVADDLRDGGGNIQRYRRLDDSDVGLRVRFR